MLDFLQRFQCLGRCAFVHIGYYIADTVVGLQVLTEDVDVQFGELAVDFAEDTGPVGVDVQDAVRVLLYRKSQGWNAQRADAGTGFEVLYQFAGDVQADAGLGFVR